jgi:NADH-quinone oxidoreductase subunit I
MSSVSTYFENIGKGFWTVLVGMKVTMRHLFTPAVTIQYPDARMSIPERGRNRLYVNMDDCIGCNQCAMACPVDCITIETAKSLPTEDLGVTSSGQKKRLWVTQFDIDFGKCCYCGLCVPPCPTECIYMTSVFEFADYDRKNLIYNFITLTPEEVSQRIKQAQEAEREAAAKKAAAAAAAAAQKAAQATQKPTPASTEAAQKPSPAQQASPAPQVTQTTLPQSSAALSPPPAPDNADKKNESKPN